MGRDTASSPAFLYTAMHRGTHPPGRRVPQGKEPALPAAAWCQPQSQVSAPHFSTFQRGSWDWESLAPFGAGSVPEGRMSPTPSQDLTLGKPRGTLTQRSSMLTKSTPGQPCSPPLCLRLPQLSRANLSPSPSNLQKVGPSPIGTPQHSTLPFPTHTIPLSHSQDV